MTEANASTQGVRPRRGLARVPWLVWVACLLALLVRLASVQFYYGWETRPRKDGVDYDALAWNLAQGHGYRLFPDQPSAWRPPGYPAMLGLLYRVFGHRYTAPRVAQCLLGAATVVVLFLLAQRLAGAAAGTVAAWIAALYPPFIALTGRFYGETLYILAVLLMGLAFVRWQRDGPKAAALLGLTTGVAILMRPNLTMFPLLALLALGIAGWPRRRVLREGLIVLGVCAACVLPWTIRNYVVLRAFVPVSTNGGVTLFISNNPWSVGGGSFDWAIVGWPVQEAEAKFRALGVERPADELPSGINYWKELGEVGSDRRYTELALSWIRADPGAFVRLIPRKLGKLFTLGVVTAEPGIERYEWLHAMSYGPVAVLALVGLLLSFRQWRHWLVCYAVMVPFIISACIFYGSPRMRVPMDPFLIVLASFALCGAWERATARRGRSPGPDACDP